MVAFILGLVSSLHCVGMCGPIAMMVPNPSGAARSKGQVLFATLLYNAGRITTYAAYGLAFGLIGRSFAWFGWQQKISITLGVLIILALVLPSVFSGNNPMLRWQNAFFQGLRERIGKLLFKGHPASLFGIGLLNGLLPCSMVYLALAGAMATGTAMQGAAFMALFGLGTLPAMAALGIFGTMVGQRLRHSARQLFPAIMVLMATLLILRGLNLGIPFVSPSLNISQSTAVECHK